MSFAAAARLKMTQLEQEGALLDRTADYDATKIMGFFVRALGPGGKTYELQINPADPGYQPLLNAFGNLLAKRKDEAQKALNAAGVS